MDFKQYEIGGRKFYQRPLGLLQAQRFADLLSGLSVKSLDARGLLEAIGENIGPALAIVLIPEGMDAQAFVKVLQRPGGLDDTILFLNAECESRQALGVLADFLAYNQPSLVLDRLMEIMETLIAIYIQQKSLNEFAPWLPEEIPLAVTPS